MLHTLSIVLLLSFCPKQNADIFTSIVELEDLLDTHGRTIVDLEAYIKKEEERVYMLKRYLNVFKKEHDKAMEDIPSYTQNPISAFTLIKRLTADLSAMDKSMQLGQELMKNMKFKHEGFKYPETEDLEGAASAIARLQRTYHLEASDLAEGKIKGVAYSSPMTASDCYELGGQLFEKGKFQYARDWMFEAFSKYYQENTSYLFSDNDILAHINETTLWLDDPERTMPEWPQKILDLVPGHSYGKELLAYYKTVLNKSKKDSPLKKVYKYKESERYKLNRVYEALCRDELDVPIQVSSRLKCRYLNENHPFLLIAPFKIEMLYLNPDVMLFHDVASDEEIETLKKLSIPKFTRAIITNFGNFTTNHQRISKVAWIADKESDIVARITRRITHMTGLSSTFAENLQVLIYGIGGHYKPHYDFINLSVLKASRERKKRGNRMATTLFYMTTVEQGGATVFPRLGLKVSPVKGTAIHWFNLHASGAVNPATPHGACPVLRGSKWVFTKWLSEFGQEFIKPCTLEKQESNHHTNKLIPPISIISK